VAAERPDVLFTHWPVATHPGRRARSLPVYDAWLAAGKKFALYHFEVSVTAASKVCVTLPIAASP
jgi:hypothetical protein